MDRHEFTKTIEEVKCRMDIAKADFTKAKVNSYRETRVETDIQMFDAAHALRRSSAMLTKLADEITGATDANA